jgi:hypothetical protein
MPPTIPFGTLILNLHLLIADKQRIALLDAPTSIPILLIPLAVSPNQNHTHILLLLNIEYIPDQELVPVLPGRVAGLIPTRVAVLPVLVFDVLAAVAGGDAVVVEFLLYEVVGRVFYWLLLLLVVVGLFAFFAGGWVLGVGLEGFAEVGGRLVAAFRVLALGL